MAHDLAHGGEVLVDGGRGERSARRLHSAATCGYLSACHGHALMLAGMPEGWWRARSWPAEQVNDEAGDCELRTDERGSLNPQSSVEVGPKLGEVGLRREFGMIGTGGAAHSFGDGFGVLGFDAGGLELAGGGEGVEGACGHGGLRAVRLREW